MKKLSALLALALAASASAHSHSEAAAPRHEIHPRIQMCAPITTAQVGALFDRWNAALQTLNPDTVAAEYHADGVLLPTVSNRVRANTADIRDYFVSFLQKRPVGTIDSQTVRIGCNSAISSGIYTFRFGDGQQVQARYSYVYTYKDGAWKIASHHSSAMPEAIDQTQAP